MTYATLMNVLDARDQLLVKLARLLFLQSLMSDNIVEELACRTKLHYKKQLTLRLNNLKKGHGVVGYILHKVG